MRLLIVLLFLTTLFSCENKKDGYELNGNISGIDEGKIVLSYFDLEKRKLIKVDSALIKGGKFELAGKLDYPQELQAEIMPGNYSFRIWMLNSQMTLRGNINNVLTNRWGGIELPVVVTGSSVQDEFYAYRKLTDPIHNEMRPYSDAYNKANMLLINSRKEGKTEEEQKALKELAYEAKDKLNPFYHRLSELDMDYVKKHPDSYVTAYLLSTRMSYIKLADLKKYFAKLSENKKQSRLGKRIEKYIEKASGAAPGSIAADFSKNDIHGKPIQLSDFKGQYVLLDFWASWCKPCRESHPHLIELYHKYHDKGIEFIGVASDDRNPKAWHKAVEKDQIGIWKHVLSGVKGEGGIGEKYDIHTLPTKILIDKQGKIIGRYSADGDSYEEMDKKLKEIFEFRK